VESVPKHRDRLPGTPEQGGEKNERDESFPNPMCGSCGRPVAYACALSEPILDTSAREKDDGCAVQERNIYWDMSVREKEDGRCQNQEGIVYFCVYMLVREGRAGKMCVYKQRCTIDDCCVNE
jgi:hypothetical protein